MRQILIWPLALAHPRFRAPPSETAGKPASAAAVAREITAALEARAKNCDETASRRQWLRQRDPLKHVLRHTDSTGERAPLTASADQAHAYGEFVFFHPFVQRFLYQFQPDGPHGREEPGRGGFALFQRADLTQAEVDVPVMGVGGSIAAQRRFHLAVDRLNLYVFDCGVAVLVLEIVALGVSDLDAEGTPLPSPPAGTAEAHRTHATLHVGDVLLLQNALRRCYPPFWSQEAGTLKWHPCEVPTRVRLYDPSQGGDALETRYSHANAHAEFARLAQVDGERSAPFFDLWRGLLPLMLDGDDSAGKGKGKVGIASWRHVVDERIPSLTFVATVDPPIRMRRGDHARLCFMDTPGSPPYAYHEGILADFEKDNCYDRFWNHGTRQLFAGYSYVVLTQSGDFARDHLVHHFRRHYFQIALLSHMEAAALLTYSGWISEALSRHGRHLGASFAADVLGIKEQLLTFVHQYRFTGLSNQLQPGEMQTYWRRHLKLDDLFADVSNEIETARDYLVAQETRDQTEASTSVAMIAGLAAVIGLPMAFLGSNFVEASNVFGLSANTAPIKLLWLFGSIAVASLAALGVLHWVLADSLLPPKLVNCLRAAGRRLFGSRAQAAHAFYGGGQRSLPNDKLQGLLLRVLAAAFLLTVVFAVWHWRSL